MRALLDYLRPRWWLDHIWGYDLFVCYRRRTSRAYAEQLQAHLKSGTPRYDVFLDSSPDGFVAGKDLQSETDRAVRSSTALIVLSERSAYADDSIYMPPEVARFEAQGKLIVPVDRDGCLDLARRDQAVRHGLAESDATRKMLETLLGKLAIEELPQANVPSEAVLKKLRGSVTSVTRAARRLQVLTGFSVLMMTLAIAAIILGRLAARARDQAEASLAEAYVRQAREAGAMGRKNEAVVYAARSLTLAESDGARQILLESHVLPLLRVFEVGTGAVQCVAFSPEGTRIAAGGSDGIPRVYSLVNESEVTELSAHTNWVDRLWFAPDGEHLLTANFGRELRWHNLRSRESRDLVSEDSDEHHIFDAIFSPDGRTCLVHWGDDARVHAIDTASGKIVNSFGHEALAQGISGGMASRADGSELAGIDSDARSVFRLRLDSLTRMTPWRHSMFAPNAPFTSGTISCLAWNRIGTRLAVGTNFDRVWVLDATSPDTTGSELAEFPLDSWHGSNPTATINDLVFADNDRLLVAASSVGYIFLWEVQQRKLWSVLRTPGGGVQDLALSPGGHFIAAACADAKVCVWEITAAVSRTEMRHRHFASSEGVSVESAVFVPETSMILTGTTAGSVHLWDRTSGSELRRWPLNLDQYEQEAHRGAVKRILVHRAGSIAWTIAQESSIGRIDLSSRRRTTHSMADSVLGADLSPDGRLLAVALLNNPLVLLEGLTGEHQQALTLPDGLIPERVRFSRNSRWLAVAGRGQVFLRDLVRGRDESIRFEEHLSIFDIAFPSADRLAILTNERDGVRQWSLKGESPWERVPLAVSGSGPLAFLGDRSLVVANSFNSTIDVHRLPTGRHVASIDGPAGQVQSLELSSDERCLLLASLGMVDQAGVALLVNIAALHESAAVIQAKVEEWTGWRCEGFDLAVKTNWSADPRVHELLKADERRSPPLESARSDAFYRFRTWPSAPQ